MDESFKHSVLMIRVPYTQVQLIYRHYKPEKFHVMIDTGSNVTIISHNCCPAQYWKDLKRPIQILVAFGQVSQLSQAVFGQFIGIYNDTTKDHKILFLPTLVLQSPPDTSYNILLGIDFLKRFSQHSSDHSTIKFLPLVAIGLRHLSCPIPPSVTLFPLNHAALMVITHIYPRKNRDQTHQKH